MEKDYKRIIKRFSINKVVNFINSIVSYEGRTTTCIATYNFNLAYLTNNIYSFNSQYIYKLARRFGATGIFGQSLCFKFTGKSLCHTEDQYDKKIGEKLATIKTKKQACHLAFQIIELVQHEIFETSINTTFCKMEIDDMTKAQNNYIKKLWLQ